jgi:hypothetical protein
MNAPADLGFACFDLLWAVLFAAAYLKVGEAKQQQDRG